MYIMYRNPVVVHVVVVVGLVSSLRQWSVVGEWSPPSRRPMTVGAGQTRASLPRPFWGPVTEGSPCHLSILRNPNVINPAYL